MVRPKLAHTAPGEVATPTGELFSVVAVVHTPRMLTVLLCAHPERATGRGLMLQDNIGNLVVAAVNATLNGAHNLNAQVLPAANNATNDCASMHPVVLDQTANGWKLGLCNVSRPFLCQKALVLGS